MKEGKEKGSYEARRDWTEHDKPTQHNPKQCFLHEERENTEKPTTTNEREGEDQKKIKQIAIHTWKKTAQSNSEKNRQIDGKRIRTTEEQEQEEKHEQGAKKAE